jgi:hypothetical protein
MKPLKFTACIAMSVAITLVCLSIGHSRTQAQAQTTSQTPNPTGVKIGSIINAAITTAFPAVSTVLNAIWPKGKESDKQTKTNAQAKLQDDQSTQQRKAALAQITRTGDELETVRIFLQASTDANEQVIAMQTLLGDKTSIDEDLKSELTQKWVLASGNLSQLKSDQIQAKIDAIAEDPFVQDSLTQVKKVNLGQIDVIKLQIEGKQLKQLRKSLDDLQPRLSAVNHVVGIVMGDMAVSLKGLPTSLTPAQGIKTPQYVEDENTRATHDYNAFKNIFPGH